MTAATIRADVARFKQLSADLQSLGVDGENADKIAKRVCERDRYKLRRAALTVGAGRDEMFKFNAARRYAELHFKGATV